MANEEAHVHERRIAVVVCPTCFALVDSNMQAPHAAWHERRDEEVDPVPWSGSFGLASDAMRSSS